MALTKARLQHIQIELGNILKPVAPFCNTRDSKTWNSLVKIHLKNPDKDAKNLFTVARVFSLMLDDKLIVAKAQGSERL
jgi:hypothetical protein